MNHDTVLKLAKGLDHKNPYIFRCYDLVSTPELQPNKSVEIIVGKCDHGPLVFNIQTNKPGPENKWNKFVSLFVCFLLEYTSIAALKALAQQLQRRTACKIQNDR